MSSRDVRWINTGDYLIRPNVRLRDVQEQQRLDDRHRQEDLVAWVSLGILCTVCLLLAAW